MDNKFNINQLVYYPSYNNHLREEVCPVCYGKLEVTLILGNDDKVITSCSYCCQGYGLPTGKVSEYKLDVLICSELIDKINVEISNGGEKYTYNTHHKYEVSEDELFATKEEAEIRGQQIKLERENEQNSRAEYLKEKNHKSYAFNVGYYRRQIKKAREDIARYEKKAILCAARAKDEIKVETQSAKEPF